MLQFSLYVYDNSNHINCWLHDDRNVWVIKTFARVIIEEYRSK